MEKLTINSRLIEAIGYNKEEKVLEIDFVDGHTTQYLDVSEAEHQLLMNAKSFGRHFLSRIRGKYTSKRITSA